MAQNKKLNVQPVALSAAVANILNPGIASLAGPIGYTQTQPYILIRHIRVVNNDAVAHTVTLYKGATGGSAVGTEIAWAGANVPANQWLDWFGELRLDAADFLTGKADVANKLTLNFDAVEIGVS